MSYAELHEWLDQVECVISELASEKRKAFDAGELSDVCNIK
jgi:hypothetical protein